MAEVNEQRYKSNSYKSRAAGEQKEVQKVVKGNVRKHEKSTSEKIKESFFGESVDNVSDYLIYDVLIPSARDLLDTFLTNAKDIILFGEVRDSGPSRGRSGSRGSYVAYDGMARKKRERDRMRARRARFDFTDIEFDDLDDIDAVIDELKDVFTVYHEISVGHFYEACGVTDIRPVDYEWGWVDIRSFTHTDPYKVKNEDGVVVWVLDLPKPKPLD